MGVFLRTNFFCQNKATLLPFPRPLPPPSPSGSAGVQGCLIDLLTGIQLPPDGKKPKFACKKLNDFLQSIRPAPIPRSTVNTGIISSKQLRTNFGSPNFLAE